jgi:hypothetical protein
MPLRYGYVSNKHDWDKVTSDFLGEPIDWTIPSGAECISFKTPQNLTVCLLTFNQKNFETLDLSQITALIAHECVHVMQRLCQNVGEDHPSMEFFAYGVQTIYQNIFNDFLKLHEEEIFRNGQEEKD